MTPDNSSAGYTGRPEGAKDLECRQEKVVGEPDEGKPHVRFESWQGMETRIRYGLVRHSRGNGEQRAALPASRAPSPDPTS